ncbi:ABC transporter ATP-binding protein [Tissierella creatinophila]|uniref:Taurine import ATP-binding protein TauB n=1 Tax=Tissierella creatinophila DSM 6911 TaxID=1123403 RepID=A0A1U7M3R8_TISCR|nr:ABC transporter ATP-binding protein [Tissierella creatinophila]OLS01890.1 taurine import ATP-binding protein TauB [Tissierella creatinophila DSM 6911]
MKYGVKNINKSYKDLKILDNISIDFEEYKTTCILGESGVGKTTLLNIIAGITDKDTGDIIGFGDEVSSFVFQEDRLIEWKNVKDNISFVLQKKIKKIEIENLIDKYLKLVNLEEYKYFYPKDLSGGMRQRISILRAFIYPSRILIMDEPFKSLDINNKQIVIELFKKLKTVEKKTCILVTHDVEEAITLGDKIVILSNKPTRVNVIIDNSSILDENDENKSKLKKVIEGKMIRNI